MELDAAGALAATVVASCGLPPTAFDSVRLPIAFHTLPSCILVESLPRHGKTLLLSLLEACIQAAIPASTVVILRCADLRRCRAPRGSLRRVSIDPDSSRTRWLACPGHAPLLARCAKAMEANAGLQDAHQAVATALAASPGTPCVVLVDDVHLLVARDSSSSGAESDAEPLDGARAVAALLCTWQCPACTATCDAAAGTLASTSDAADQGTGAGNVCAVLTTASASGLPQGAFPLPHSIVCQRMAYVDEATDPSKWVSAFLRQFDSGYDGYAGLSAERPAPDPLSFLARALTVDRPPLRMALRAAAVQMMRGGAAAAFDRAASAASASCPIDLVLRIQPPPEVPRYPLRITGPQLQQLRGLHHASVAVGTVVRAGTDIEPHPLPTSEALDGAPSASTGSANSAAAAPAASSTVWSERTRLSLVDVACDATAKAEALRSIVLPLLAWQHLLSGLPAPPAGVDGSSSTRSSTSDVAVLAAAMARMRVAPPSGLLLHGPPGSGKSTLAVGIAKAARMRLLVVDAALLLSRFVGDSEASIRRLFRAARTASPCCLVLENLEVVGGARAGGGGGAREGAQEDSSGSDLAAVTTVYDAVADADGGIDAHAEADADYDADFLGEETEAATAAAAPATPSSSKVKPKLKPKLKPSQRFARSAAAAAAPRPRLTRNLPVPSSSSVSAGSAASGAGSPSAAGGASAAGSARGAASVHDRMLATLLTEMDGVGIKRSEAGAGAGYSTGASARSGGPGDGPMLLVIGVTEHRSAIDPALLRPGRLDRHIYLPPSHAARGSETKE